MKTRHIIIAALAAATLGACSHRTGWSVEGTLADVPAGTPLVLEADNAGHWYTLDTLRTDADGKFAYMASSPSARPDILRLTLAGKGSVYFPVDSIDAVTVEASAADFSRRHTVKGTPMAERFGYVDSLCAASAVDETLLRELVGVIAADTTGLVAYYTVGKAVDGRQLFDANDAFGNRVYGAAAQVYATRRPMDARGRALRAAYFAGRQALGRMPQPAEQVIEVPETGVIDIVRYDCRGNRHSLAEDAAKGNVVLLNFTDYTMANSPAYNAMLNQLYTTYGSRGLTIYQIAFNDDEVAWKETAQNLPWTAVWNSTTDGLDVLRQYNVGGLPTTFIIDRQGTIAERVEDGAELPRKVARLF